MASSAPIARPGQVTLLLLAGVFLANMDITVVNIAAPSIRDELGASGAEVTLAVGAYVLSYAVLLVTGARLGELAGYRRMFLTGLTLFGVASFACGLAGSPGVLVASRLLQGAGAALMVPQALSVIQTALTGESRGRAIAWYPLALSLSAVVGQVTGGLIVAADIGGTEWRPIFLVNVPIVAVLAVAAARRLPADEPHPDGQRLDGTGVVLLSAALVLLLFPLVIGREEGWPAWSIACLAASLPVLAALVLAERRVGRRGGRPLLDLDLLTRPAVGWRLLAQGAIVSTYFALLFTLALHLQDGLGHGPIASGLTLVPWVVSFGLAGPLLRRAPARLQAVAAPAGCAALAVVYLAVTGLLAAGVPDGVALGAVLACGGAALGTAFSALLGGLVSNVPERLAPDVSGLFSTTSQLAGAIGVAAFGSLHLGLAGGEARAEAIDGFAVVVAAFAITAALGALAAAKAIRARTAT